MSETVIENDAGEAPDPLAPDENAPYGYTVDRATGERRPKKTSGRPRAGSDDGPTPGQGSSPPPDELKAGPKVSRGTDRTPVHTHTRRFGRSKADRKPQEPVDVPPFRAGPIATGMNKLYAKAGKIIRVMDPELGGAILACTRKESPDDTTVGEAWEELARTNPRIRAFLLKMIQGGAWTQLFMAHAPIFLAVIMKPSVSKHIPFMGIVDAVLTEDDGSPSEESGALGGMEPQDVQQMMDMAQGLAAQMGMGPLDISAMMRAATNGTGRQPDAGGNQYAGFTPPADGGHGG